MRVGARRRIRLGNPAGRPHHARRPPIKGHEHYEIGSNSLQHLSWHTEDAFHPCRGDYVALMCLKNPDLVETVVCDAGDLDWSVLDVEALFEPEFTQMPDNSHRPQNARSPPGTRTWTGCGLAASRSSSRGTTTR